MSFACLWLILASIVTVISESDLLLNGHSFPSYLYVPLDETSVLECDLAPDYHTTSSTIYWKLYLNTGKIEIVHSKLIHLTVFNRNRDGFYQCHVNDASSVISRGVFIFSNGAHVIDRTWTNTIEFENNTLTFCRSTYFHTGFNEQFIELIDNQQIVRYNRSVLLVKHIRSTTHLLCKIHVATVTVGVRVRTLIRIGLDAPLLSDDQLKHNSYLEMNKDEQDIQRIAFEGDDIYLNCPSVSTTPVLWQFLSWNCYQTKILPTIYDRDTKVKSLSIGDAGLYTCQTGNVVHKRVVLTILHPPKAPDGVYQRSLDVDLNSTYLICCNLDAIPYPTYSWSMAIESQTSSSVWCKKRCCWLHVLHHEYRDVICTSTNKFGMAKYILRIFVRDTTNSNAKIVYQEPISRHYHLNDDNAFENLIHPESNSNLMTISKPHIFHPIEESKSDKIDEELLANVINLLVPSVEKQPSDDQSRIIPFYEEKPPELDALTAAELMIHQWQQDAIKHKEVDNNDMT